MRLYQSRPPAKAGGVRSSAWMPQTGPTTRQIRKKRAPRRMGPLLKKEVTLPRQKRHCLFWPKTRARRKALFLTTIDQGLNDLGVWGRGSPADPYGARAGEPVFQLEPRSLELESTRKPSSRRYVERMSPLENECSNELERARALDEPGRAT